MKLTTLTAIATLTLLGSTSWAANPTDMKGAETPNGKVVMAFLDLEMAKHDPAAAFDKYVHKDYKNKFMGGATKGEIPNNNFEGQKKMEVEVFGGKSMLSVEIKKVVAAEDFVFVQALGRQAPGAAKSDQLWMLFRLKDGKIIEHADLHMANPDGVPVEQFY
jgi:predicted SnoaL-like aldol condensation-catalyzing enzyme